MTVLRVNTGEYTSTIGIYPGYNHKTIYLPVDGHKISPISRECVSLSHPARYTSAKMVEVRGRAKMVEVRGRMGIALHTQCHLLTTPGKYR